MAITYRISRNERLIRAFARGIVRATDLHGLVKSVLADPGMKKGMRGLYDSRFGEPDVTVLELAEVATEVRELAKKGLGRVALVAASDTTYRVEKTFSILARAQSIEVEVFRDLAAAESWVLDDRPKSQARRSHLSR